MTMFAETYGLFSNWDFVGSLISKKYYKLLKSVIKLIVVKMLNFMEQSLVIKET